MVVIQFNAMIDEYQLERMSKMYAQQAERGAIVLPAGAKLVWIDEPVIIEDAAEPEPEEETE